MKKKLFVFLFLCSVSVSAQDVIVKKDGCTILSKVLEVNTTDIKYKKFSNQSGPIYTISKSELLSVNYENGDKDDFSGVPAVNSKESDIENSCQFTKKLPASNNVDLISTYNTIYQPTSSIVKKNKRTPHYMLIYGMKQSSILSNEDIEINLVRTPAPLSSYGLPHIVYYINIKNKTNKTIYIDKGNCFRIFHNGSSVTFFENTEQVSVNQGRGSGSSLNIGSIAGAIGIGGAIGQIAGGINVGGGRTHSVSRAYTPQRFIAIPPNSNKNLSEEKIMESVEGRKDYAYILVDYGEYFNFDELGKKIMTNPGGGDNIYLGDRPYFHLTLPENLVKMGQTIIYSEENSPMTQSYIIAYSTNQEFTSFSTVQADLYLHEIIGTDKIYKMGNIMGSGAKLLSEKYIEGINEHTLEGYYLAY